MIDSGEARGGSHGGRLTEVLAHEDGVHLGDVTARLQRADDLVEPLAHRLEQVLVSALLARDRHVRRCK